MFSRTIDFPRIRLPILLFIVLLLVVACGRNRDAGDASGSQSPSADRLAAPTMPAGQFVAVGEQSVLTGTANLTETIPTTQTAQITGTAQITQSGNAATTADLTRGETAYIKNKCGDCHGAKGEGVTDKGGPVAGTTIAFAEFDKVLRTGGGLGNTHIFGRSAVSPSGMEALYAYVQSLGQ